MSAGFTFCPQSVQNGLKYIFFLQKFSTFIFSLYILKECMVIKQATGVQASVKVLGVKEETQKGVTAVYFFPFLKEVHIISDRKLCSFCGEGS